MNLLKALRVDSRKEVGQSVAIAKHLLEEPSALQELFDILLNSAKDPIIVSHGTYALKELALLSSKTIQKTLMFFIENKSAFKFWEAKENFLRIVLISPKTACKVPGVEHYAEALSRDKSAIVTTYAIETLCRIYHMENRSADVTELLKQALNNGKASVRARARILSKEFQVDL